MLLAFATLALSPLAAIWTRLNWFSPAQRRVRAFNRLMLRLSHVRPGRKFTREEMNER